MMGDLLRYYVNYLNSNGYVARAENERIRISIAIENIEIVLYCVLGRFFPYEIPEVFIDEESKKVLPKMPHLCDSGNICIFDEGKVVPNFNAPEKLLLITIETAINVISEGIQEKNSHDFIDEFLEYWSNKGMIRAEMFVEKDDDLKSVCWCLKKETIIIAENKHRLEEISNAIDHKNIKEYCQGLLIPVDGCAVENIPRTDVDIIQLIENNSLYKNQYNSFMQKNINTKCLVIFNLVMPEGNMLAGWIHDGPGVPNGFRRNHVNLKMAFSMTSKKGVAVSIANCCQKRLFLRGGDGRDIIWKKAAIIGCGSVGSFLADALKLYGTEKFVLVDNEKLGYENIARHVCGYMGVGMAKVSVLGFWFQKHNPNITYEEYPLNAHEVLEDKTDVLNTCDVLFVAVASVAVEHHINQLIKTDKLARPVIIIWVEPYMIGGHAILIRKKQDLYKDIFDAHTLEYKKCIVENSDDFLKREAGCQSTYMPYSGFMLQQFIYRVMEYILSNCWDKKGNYLLTWCGKLSGAKLYGMKINEEYKHVKDYTLITQRID